MGKGAEKNNKVLQEKSSQKNDKTDASLLEDVRKYAAELGFPAAGGGMSSFDDFAPGKAKKKLSRQAKKSNKSTSEKKEDGSNREKETSQKGKVKNEEKKAPRKSSGAFEFSLPAIPKDAASMKSVFSLKDEGLWYELAEDIPESDGSRKESHDEALVAELRSRAARLLEVESILVAKDAALSKNSTLSWLQQAKQGGTTSDKVAAMAVLVQEFPVGHLQSLEGLVAMAGKRGGARAVVGTTLDALLELWKDVLLPEDRKLRFFTQQPLSKLPKSSKSADRCLVLWEFEDRLKLQYATFVEQLAVLSTDNLEFIKEKATKVTFELLLHRSEQEGQLLKIMVNKLGDPDRKIASNAGYLLTKLLSHHAGMKHVVVREIENFIYRPGLKDRARYYAVVYLNQIVLSKKDVPRMLPNGTKASLAKRLVDIYFSMFKLIIEGSLGTAASIAQAKQEKVEKRRQEKALKKGKKKFKVDEDSTKVVSGERQGSMDSRMLSALITGIRRAFPFVTADEIEPLIDAHADSLFKLIHTGSFGVATQALLLLYQLMSSQSSISDRFYRALYATLLNKELPGSTKAPLFLSLFLKAIKDDVSINRVTAFLKRLLQVALEAPANFACGCLIILSQILKDSRGIWNSISDPEEIDEERPTDGKSEDDLLYDPIKRDPKYARAERTCFWELVPLSNHSHPSVAAMANSILAGMPVQYNGDPLKDFVLSEFLDKFITKKSKPRSRAAGDSLMQPTATESKMTSALESYENKHLAPDEAFFHKFFELGGDKAKRVKRSRKEEVDSDDESSLAEDDFLAGEEGDDAAYGDLDGEYDYAQLEEAMQEDEAVEDVTEDESISSLEGEKFPSSASDSEASMSLDGSDIDDDNTTADKDDIFASLDDYSEMIEKDFSD